MSTNSMQSEEKGGGASPGLGATQAPRLLSGGAGYAAWQPLMDAYLQRSGAEGVHSTPMTEEAWIKRRDATAKWASEALAAAEALALGDAAGHGALDDGPAVKAEELSPALKEARRVVAALVERSRRAYGAIYHAIPEELRAQAAHIPAGWAYGLWHWLQVKFQSTEADAVGDLLADWMTLQQGDAESFDAYRARVNKLAALLEAAKEKPSARMFALILLDRLQPRFKAAVLALKAGGQLADAEKIEWDTVAALLNAHERNELRLDGDTAAGGAEGKAMATRAWSHPRSKASSSSGQQREAPEEGAQREDRGRGRHPSTLADVQCFNCNDFGHMARRCPKADKRQGGQRGRAPGGPAASAGEGEKTFSAVSVNPYAALEEEEAERVKSAGFERAYTVTHAEASTPYLDAVTGKAASQRAMAVSEAQRKAALSKLVDAKLAKEKREAAAAAAAAAPGAPKVAKPAAEPAGPARGANAAASDAAPSKAKAEKKQPTGVSPDKSLKGGSWGMDSMASLNVSGNRALFGSLRRCAPVVIQVADGKTVTAQMKGNTELRVITTGGKSLLIPIEDVYYHDSFAVNLLSMNVLRARGWTMHCSPEESYMLTPRNNKVMLSTQGRVSILHSTPGERVYALGGVAAVTNNVGALVRAHETFGHMSYDQLKRLLDKGSAVADLPKIHASDQEHKEARLQILDCEACAQGKGCRTPFGQRGIDKGSAPGETLHMDTYQVPVPVPDRPGQTRLEYGLTITDPYTGWRANAALASKDEAAAKVIAIVQYMQTQLECKVKRLYSDGGTEFVNQTLKGFCAKNGVELHYPPARTQQLNGVAENAVRSVKDATRTLMLAAKAPERLWRHAAHHATFLWNRAHVAKMTGKTPFESLMKRKPSAKHWGVFGCDALVHLPKEQRGPLAAKREPCIYLGHDQQQDCACVLVLRTNKVIQSRDVSYRMGSFAYMAALVAGEARVAEALAGPVDELDFLDPSGLNPEREEEEEKKESSRPESKEDVEEVEEVTNEYEVDKILESRSTKRDGAQFKVQWSSGEVSWEPAAMMEADAPLAVKEFLETLPLVEPPAPRRSPRFAQDEEDDVEPQVHMAMGALLDSQPNAAVSNRELMCAVQAGIALLEQRTPASYREAMAGPDAPKWKGATVKEVGSIITKKVWTVVPRPKGANVIPAKWVLKIKTDSDGNITDWKARLTPKGFRQKEGVDYGEVFARTGMYKSMRVGLSLTARWDHELEQLDVPTAFLNADLDEEIYMELPEGFSAAEAGGDPALQGDMVCKLHKALYGLKQAPRMWYIMISRFILETLGFKASVSDPCLFYKRSKTGRLILLFLFVDDMQGSFHGEDKAEWAALKALLVERFQTKDMGASTWILGMRIIRDRAARTITLDQELYVTKALEKYGLAQCKVADTPEVVGAAHAEPTEQERLPTDKQRYMEITGSLMYAAISTRPDIAHAVHHLASNMLAPTEKHMAAATRVLRYLAGTKDVGLVFGSRVRREAMDAGSRSRGELQVDACAFADADWANDKKDRKSITGWVAKLNGDTISWASKKQRVVALSTCEAELYAESAAIQEVLWLRGLLRELGLKPRTGSLVYGDNQSAIAVSKNGVKGERTKHVDVKYHFVTETVEAGDVLLKWVPTAEQQADIFTKALGAPAFHQFRRELMTR